MSDPRSEGIEGRREGGIARLRPFLVPIALFGIAGLLFLDPWPAAVPLPEAEAIPGWAVDVRPVRRPVLRPETTVAVYRFRCGECHSLMISPPETDRPLTQHTHIHLEHGINARCFNCHHRTNRDAYADDRGDPIPYGQPQLLCAKCHGPVYRDWTHGVHGRTNGFWDPKYGPMERKKCVECHDPHKPAFESLKPAPPPRTLRMGDQAFPEAGGEGTKNPLRIFRKDASER